MEILSIGMVLDHIQAYVDSKTPPDKRVKEATQSDINMLKR